MIKVINNPVIRVIVPATTPICVNISPIIALNAPNPKIKINPIISPPITPDTAPSAAPSVGFPYNNLNSLRDR